MSFTALPRPSVRTARGRVAIVAVTTLLGLASGLVAAPTLADAPPRATAGAGLLAADDDEVVLPTRVGSAVDRVQRAINRSEDALDNGQRKIARRSLAGLATNLRRAYRAATVQMTAVPADPEAETTPGPDSVVAVLVVDQLAIARLGNLYDGVKRKPLVAAVKRSSRVAAVLRARLLGSVVALDPEGAGADYADGMADTVDGYTDEVATLQEALATDRLIAPARQALRVGLARSLAAQAAVTAAFGGGE